METIDGLWRAQVARGGEDEALVCVDAGGAVERWSWRALGDRADALARGLAASAIARGDRVAVHLPNGSDFLAIWMAIAKIGATLVPINLRSASDELRYALGHARAAALVATAAEHARHAAATAELPALRLRIAVAGEAPGTIPLHRLADPGPFEDRGRPDDDAAILYTSGTTRRPKGVRLPHAALCLAARRMVENTALRAADRHAVAAPMYHVNALGYSILPAIAAGASLLLMERFSRSRWLAWATEHGATVASLVSSMIRLLLDNPPTPADRAHRLRLIGCASRSRAIEERFGVATIGWYGMTETVGVPIVTPLGGGRFGAVGRARDGYRIRVRAGGRSAAPDEVGELEVAGTPGRDLMAGYLDDEEASRAALSEEPDGTWLRTGDLVRRDADGWVYYVERGGDVIRRGGENVSAAEVERALGEHPAVREAAAVGLPDRVLGQRVAAAVVLRDGAIATAEELRAHAARLLADFKVPTEVRIVPDLPRATLDKVNRAALKAGW